MKHMVFIIQFFILLYSCLAQINDQIIFYGINNTGFPIAPSDYTFDGNGNLLVTHFYRSSLEPGGLTVYDGKHWELTNKDMKDFPFEDGVKVFYSPNDNRTYVYGSYLHSDAAGQQYRLIYLDELENKWKLLGDSASFAGMYDGGLTDMVVTPNGEIYAATGNGFFHMYSDSCRKLYPPDNLFFTAQNIALKPDGSLYLLRGWSDGWGNSFLGIYSYYGGIVDTLKDPLDSLHSCIDWELDNHGNLWLLGNNNQTRENCLVKYSNGIETKFNVSAVNSSNLSLVLDGDYLWIGTSNGDLIKFNTLTYDTTMYKIRDPNLPGSLGSYDVQLKKIVPHNDHLYIKMSYGSIIQVNKNTGEVTGYRANANTGLPNSDGNAPVINSMIIDHNNHYWFNSLNDGTAMFNGDYWTTFSHTEISKNMVTTSWDIASDRKGNIYTVGDSIRAWNEANSWRTFLPPTSMAPNFYGQAIEVDKDNNVWIADIYDGLLKYNPTTDEFTKYSSNDIGNNSPQRLFIDSKGNLWIGYKEYGITKYDGSSFTFFGLNDGIEGSYATDIDETPDGSIWVSFLNNGIAKFDGSIWHSYTQSNSDIPIAEIRSMAIDLNGNIWIGSNVSDTVVVYSSVDGSSWNKKIIDPDHNATILDLMVDANNNLFISAGNLGIYVYNPDNVVLEAKNIDGNLPETFKLYQNYPNPFNPTTNIKYSIPSPTNDIKNILPHLVTLKIYDVIGREVSTLVNENQIPGNYQVKFNAGNLSSGIYFYRLSIGNKNITKKMLLLK